MTPEGKVKQYLKKQCEKRGYLCIQTVCPAVEGWPDREIIGLNGTYYVEVKESEADTKNEHVARQLMVLQELRTKYFAKVYFAVGKEGVDEFLKEIDK